MIKEKLKFLLKDSFIYGLSNALSKFFQFITIPIITQFISVEQFGVWGILFLYGYIVVGILMMGMDSAVIRYFYDNESHDHKSKLFSLGLSSQSILYLLFILLYAITRSYIPDVIDVPSKFINEIDLVALWAFFNLVTQYCQNWFKWTFQRVKFMVLSLGFTGINLLLLFLLLREGRENFSLIFYATVAAQFVSAALGLFWCRSFLRFYFNSKTIKTLISFGLPMMLVFLFGNLSSSLDRIFLINYLDPKSFGIYSFGQKLSMAMSIFVSAFQIAFGPFIYSQWDKEGSKELFSIVQRYYIIGISFCALGLTAFGPFLIRFMGNESYLPSYKILPFLSFGILLSGLYSFASIGIFYSKKPFFNLICLFTGLVLNILVNFLLTPLLLEYGAVIGFITGNLGLISLGYFLSHKYYSINYSFLKDGLHLIFLILIFVISSQLVIVEDLYINSVILGIINSLVFLMGVYFLLNHREKNFVNDLLKRRKNLV